MKTARLQRTATIVALLALMACPGLSEAGRKKAKIIPVQASLEAQRVVCWLADGEGMHPTGEIEEFLVDRLGASGDRIALDPGVAHRVIRLLGLQHRTVFDPTAADALARAAGARWVLWVKLVSRDVQSKKLLGIPYLFNRRRLDAHVFYDVRIYDAQLQSVLGSKRLKLSDRGEATWQVTDNERLDPIYNNDPVEFHNRHRKLDWRAAAMISGFCAAMLSPERLAMMQTPESRVPASTQAVNATPARATVPD